MNSPVPHPSNFGAPLLRSADIRVVEARNAQLDLMRRAGHAAAHFLVERSGKSDRIVLLAGPGNNGGDAFACAADLQAAGYQPVVIFPGDDARLPADAAQARQRALDAGVRVERSLESLAGARWIVDGLFGIGLKRPLDAGYRAVVQAVAAARRDGACVLALDVPSGIDADTGALVGDTAVAADHTVTFIAGKPGLFTGPALDFVGRVHVATLELDLQAGAVVYAYDLAHAQSSLRPARANEHKGSRGTLGIVGGADGMLGAAILASRAAMRMGAGKVKVAWLAEPHPQVDPLMPEVMMHGAADTAALADCTALVIGCGLGQSRKAMANLRRALERPLPLLLDADALNLLARSALQQNILRRRQHPAVITPHPTEAARLLGCSTIAVQHDRLQAAHELAQRFGVVAVLKGAGSIVDDGARASINRTGSALLATAGTGDVLAGMIGALLAQGHAAAQAARIGVALHGAAADSLAAQGVKRLVAGDVVAALARV